MLPLKDYSQNFRYSLLGCAFIHHLIETWLIRQIVHGLFKGLMFRYLAWYVESHYLSNPFVQ